MLWVVRLPSGRTANPRHLSRDYLDAPRFAFFSWWLIIVSQFSHTVQALYAHNKYIKFTMVAFLATEVVVMSVCINYAVRGLVFNDICIVTSSNYAILGYG